MSGDPTAPVRAETDVRVRHEPSRDGVEELLGVQVNAGGVSVGTVAAVLVDGTSGDGLVAEVSSSRSEPPAYLPLRAARREEDALCASALAFLPPSQMTFYADGGVVRVASDGRGPFREGGREIGVA